MHGYYNSYQDYIVLSASDSVDNRMERQQRRGHVYRGLIDIVEFIEGFAVSLFSSSPGSGVVQRVGDRVYYWGGKKMLSPCRR